MHPLATVKYKISKIKELQDLTNLVKEILHETIPEEEYISPLFLIEIIKDFAREIDKKNDEIESLKEQLEYAKNGYLGSRY